MRSLNYVQRVSLDFTGTLFPHAICLGDADNDTLNELVVGDTSGKLHVYKNDDSKAWITRSCVGTLTCVAVGDVRNKGKVRLRLERAAAVAIGSSRKVRAQNFVVAVGAEGWFHLFDLSAAKADSSGQHEGFAADEQKPFFTQHIPANTKVILISDIDGDGRSELVVGYTDRVVRAFRWEEPSDASDAGSGQLLLLKKWLLEGQVDSLSVNPGPEGLPELMVSQPGCGYAVLLCSWTQRDSPPPCDAADGEEDARAASAGDGPSRDVVLRLTTGRIHNKNVSTHLIGSIGKGSKEESSKCGLFALCTLDGTLKLMDSSEQLLWSVQVDHQLFALQKLDVTVKIFAILCLDVLYSQKGRTPRFRLYDFRGTGARRWWRAPGTARRTSSTTTGPWCASSLTRTLTPSARVSTRARRARTARVWSTSASTTRSTCTGRCSWSAWSPPTCCACWTSGPTSGGG
ncbi:KICSTOR complex protein ITFG2 isoform X2 [Phyllopteryx taeniolatus]|uniref:KICSTOR complex protein ITFG2 isoform X2 n=1 Tax=Phyllopteryx taeniolatus TaxID=161469 RepID=UPI002AD35F88|nr:KICSTOR complex protein ITFG2 isoform X2 [Phyllopteryx taeniolatus]XP_061617999.1 KICSTOR complex protein ITFG2 isoform X2 [Phyllopteryx taeniolatus]